MASTLVPSGGLELDPVGTVPINGYCDPAFRAVLGAFRENLSDPTEVGESVCIYVNGRVVVDLWGGYRDGARFRPWLEDTIVTTFSLGKPLSTLPVLMLADRGDIGLKDPVAKYWPEFAQAGKAEITIDELVSHQARIPGALAATEGDAYDWFAIVRAIEQQEPMWERYVGCYQTFTMGHQAGELVRRVTGKSIGQFVQQELAKPLALDFHFGLAIADQDRCAAVVHSPNAPFMILLKDRSTLAGRCWIPLPLACEDFNSAPYRAAEIPASNGHSNARSMARFFAALAEGGSLEGTRILSERMVDLAVAERWSTVPDPLGFPFRFSRGFMLQNEFMTYDGEPDSFGHIGVSGSLGFGTRRSRVGFAFVPNRIAPIITMGEYGTRLAEALKACL
jgi:CubicO group peptidase (beta-lactamase class C family)